MSIRAQVRPRARPLLLASLALVFVAPASVHGAPAEPDGAKEQTPAQAESELPAEDPFTEPAPRDPDDAPFLSPPRNQLGQWSAGRTRPRWIGYDDDHWVQLTIAPVYAAIHTPLFGRGGGVTRGGGFGLELDLRITRWLFFRVFGSHTLHPAFEETFFDEDDQEVTLTANEGLIHATNTGGSLVYALDIGRYVPRVDVGAGMLFLRTPEAAQSGQWGGECRQGGVCDLGLSCDVENMCRPAPVPEVHIGVGLDVLFGRRWTFGLAVRYYALFAALDALPFYLQGSARFSVRF